MSKLLQDPKVAALVDKATAKAAKETTKRLLTTMKDQGDAIVSEDPTAKKAVAQLLKAVKAGLKEAA